MTNTNPIDVALENRLMSHGIYMDDVDWLDGEPTGEPRDGDGMALAYETVAETPVVTSQEVGAVVRTLLAVADEREWTPGRLEVASKTTDGEPRGYWHVEADWFDALGTDLTETEFSQRVLRTIDEAPADA
jgi:hypothetical protein